MSSSKERLSVWTKLGYGSGAISECLMANVILILALPIYNVGLGVQASLVGLAISLPKLLDAFIDPIIGNISDNFTSRWGRRRVFILAGAIIGGSLFAIMWFPLQLLPKNIILIYFTLSTIIYYIAYSIFFVPYNALGFELSDDYDERTRVMSFKALSMNIASCCFLPFVYKMCFWLGKSDGASGTKIEVDGVKYVGLIFGVIMIMFGIIPAIVCRERVRMPQTKTPFVESIKTTLSNKAFLILCGIIFFMLCGVMVGTPLTTYLNICYIFDGDRDLASSYVGYTQFIGGAVGILCIPVLSYCGVKFGKKRALIGGIVLCLLGYLLSIFYMTPKYPALQFVSNLFLMPGVSSIWIFTYAMIADICDFDELTTGKRREGSFGAVYALIMKTGAAAIIMISGVVVDLCGFNPEVIRQTPETILKIRLVYAFAPVGFLLIALYLTMKFPITKEKLEAVKKQLQQKDGITSAS